MAWMRLDDSILSKGWWVEMTPEQRSCYITILIQAAALDGRIVAKSTRTLAQLLRCSHRTLAQLLSNCDSRLIFENGVCTVRDWEQWNPKRDSSKDRVRAYREKNRHDVTVDVTGCNALRNGDVTPLRNGTERNDTEHISSPNGELSGHPQADDPVHSACHAFAKEWNERVCREVQSIKPITLPLSKRRYQHLRARLGQSALLTAWKSGDLWKAISDQRFLHGQNARGWILTFDKLIERQGIFEGVIERKYSNGPPGKLSPDSDADRHKEAREQLKAW